MISRSSCLTVFCRDTSAAVCHYVDSGVAIPVDCHADYVANIWTLSALRVARRKALRSRIVLLTSIQRRHLPLIGSRIGPT